MTFKVGDILKSKEGENYYIIAFYDYRMYAFYKIGNVVVKILPRLLENVIVVGNIEDINSMDILKELDLLDLAEYIKENKLLINI